MLSQLPERESGSTPCALCSVSHSAADLFLLCGKDRCPSEGARSGQEMLLEENEQYYITYQ